MGTKIESKGQLAVVTGASTGIGFELAKVFAKNGFDLLVTAENDQIQIAAKDFRALGVSVQVVQTDLARPDGSGVDELYSTIKTLGRPVDCIAINAGVGVGGEFITNNFQAELNLMQLNIISLVHLTKHVLRDMVSVGRGKILFTSSIAGEMPGPYYAVYAASKAFVQSFSEAIRYEVKDKGVSVTALQPGATDTPFFARAGMLDTKAGASKKDSPAEVAQQGFDALMAGRDHVVAGSLLNNVQSGVAKIISEKQAAGLHAKQTKPGSGRN